MKPLVSYIYESIDDLLKLSGKQRKELLKHDREYHTLMDKIERISNAYSHVHNTEELIDKIKKASKKDDMDYVPELEYDKLSKECNISDDKTYKEFQDEIGRLIVAFTDINCYVSKFYIEKLKQCSDVLHFLNEFAKDTSITPKVIVRPSKRIYKYALELLKKYPYESVKKMSEEDPDFKRNVPAEKSQKRLQKAIDKRDMDWKVELDANMIPRMSVKTWNEFDISDHNLFSEVDLQSLEVHEVEVHTGRKHNALKSGLFLMLHGLRDASILDEGCAIYNTIHHTKKMKPNIRFWIAIKIFILYHLYSEKKVMEIYKELAELTGQERISAFAIVRALRVPSNGYVYSRSCDSDYLTGYMLVKQLSQEERDELIKFNIGPDQMHEIDTLKKFFELNEFDELTE